MSRETGHFEIDVSRDTDRVIRLYQRGQEEGGSGIDHGRHATKIAAPKSNGDFTGVVAASV
ncbi:MAG: hypothetical protein WCK95_18875 [Alphaproteobacteria bacterium]